MHVLMVKTWNVPLENFKTLLLVQSVMNAPKTRSQMPQAHSLALSAGKIHIQFLLEALNVGRVRMASCTINSQGRVHIVTIPVIISLRTTHV